MKRPLIVAEIGANHLGSLKRAERLVIAARKAGADAVKFQCFTPEQMADPGVMIESGPWQGRELLDLYRETHTPREWFPALFATAREHELIPFASVFHPDDVDFLETLACSMYKISSFEMLDLPLIERVAATSSNIVISTGMATQEEIAAALRVIRDYDALAECTLLKCTSAYPATCADANLLTLADMVRSFACDIGLSDHTMGHSCAVAATVLGASMIEKHLILDRADDSPDAAFSSTPAEFETMVDEVWQVHACLGRVHYFPVEAEASSLPLRRPPGGKRGTQ